MKLYLYQESGIEFLVNTKRAILADSPGLGKTVQAIKAARQLCGNSQSKILVVAPNSVKYVWEQEIAKWSNAGSVVLGGRIKEFNPVDFVIINYEALGINSWFNKIYWQCIIYDEFTRVKNRKAAVTKAAFQLKSNYVFFLSGTPFLNHPSELFPALKIIDSKKYRSYWKFVESFCDVYADHWSNYNIGEVKDINGLKKELQPLYCRREKSEVLKDLPAKTYQTIPIELYPEQRKAYEQMKKEMIAQLKDTEIIAPVDITKLLRFRQIAGSLGIFQEQDISSKLDACVELIEDLGKKVVVFSAFKSMVYLLRDRLLDKGIKNIGLITGDQIIAERQEYIDMFQSKEYPNMCNVMLGTIGAMGLGITLTAADTCIFLDKDYVPANNEQASSRLHRIGQKNNVEIIHLMAKDTVEQYVESLLKKKQNIFDKVFSKEEFVKLL